MNEMNAYIKKLIEDKLLVGMIGADIDGDTITRFQYGTIDGINTVDETYLYDIASLTKLFTTTRILQLMESKMCSLDDPIQKYLPQFKSNAITLKHCLCHRSGLAASCSGRYTMNAKQLKDSILNCDDLINPVDSIMVYSCINFIVLSYVIEAIDGDFEATLINKIFKQCSMKETMFNPDGTKICVPTSMDKGVLQHGIVDDTTARVLGGISGNAGLFSTLHDLVQFVRALLNNTLLNESTIELISSTNIDGRSIGWNRYDFRGKSILYHTGYTGPSILIIPELKKGLILLTNRSVLKPNPEYIQQRLEIFNYYLSQQKY